MLLSKLNVSGYLVFNLLTQISKNEHFHKIIYNIKFIKKLGSNYQLLPSFDFIKEKLNYD